MFPISYVKGCKNIHQYTPGTGESVLVYINPFPTVYKFIWVFPSAANKYICFIFLIRSSPATNIFVQTIDAPAHMRITVTAIFNAENIFNNLKYIVYYGYFQPVQVF